MESKVTNEDVHAKFKSDIEKMESELGFATGEHTSYDPHDKRYIPQRVFVNTYNGNQIDVPNVAEADELLRQGVIAEVSIAV